VCKQHGRRLHAAPVQPVWLYKVRWHSCGDNSNGELYMGIRDKDGGDFNSYRLGINWPGYICESSGIKFANNGTCHSDLLKVPAGGRLQWVPLCGYMKLFTVDQKPDRIPGDSPVVSIPVTFICAGNRRKEQNMTKKTIGFNWVPEQWPTACGPEFDCATS